MGLSMGLSMGLFGVGLGVGWVGVVVCWGARGFRAHYMRY